MVTTACVLFALLWAGVIGDQPPLVWWDGSQTSFQAPAYRDHPVAPVAADQNFKAPDNDTRMSVCNNSKSGKTVYDFNATLLNGKNQSLSAYKGEVLMIINVATY